MPLLWIDSTVLCIFNPCARNAITQERPVTMHDLLCKLYDAYKKSKLSVGLQRMILGDIENRLFRINQFNVSTALLHQKTFLPYKNKFCGRDVALIACGPTINDFAPIPNAIYVGVNRAFRCEKLKLDYLFLNDGGMAYSRDEMHEINRYGNDFCQKFYGIFEEQTRIKNFIISESDAIEAKALRYHIDYMPDVWELKPRFTYDISTQALGGRGTVTCTALQFIMWCNPKRVFLVGCDCSNGGAHFYKDNKPTWLALDDLKQSYGEFKCFAARYYPDTEIVSVNPVGLKGLFRDWYQKDGPLD